VPAEGEINTTGIEVTDDQMRELLRVDSKLLHDQLPQLKEHLARFGDNLPDEIQAQLDALEKRLGE
jgi:phosphoenolpyruvate carboxykinase (GTP)